MPDYRVIADSEVQPDAPVTSSLGFALRDNPAAIAQGADGAPRIQREAMGTWISTSGGVGTLAFAKHTDNAASYSFGQTISGALLAPSNAAGEGGGSLSGTWRCLGIANSWLAGAEDRGTTLWVRVS